MNITALKHLVANLPSDITPDQFAQVEMEVEEILAAQRQADEAELAAAQERVRKLQEKLGKPVAAPPVKRQKPQGDTDADMGLSYDVVDVSCATFQEELAALRRHSVSKRSLREH